MVNRKGGVPPLDEICQEIVARFSNDGGRGWEVLGYMCPRYRLRYEAVNKGRPVLLAFHLQRGEWKRFTLYFENDKTRKGIFKYSDLVPLEDDEDQDDDEELEGHEVVVIEMTEKCV